MMNQLTVNPDNSTENIVCNGYSKASAANYTNTTASAPNALSELTKDNSIYMLDKVVVVDKVYLVK